jgi:protein-arginine kinase activator protein McsA
MECGECSDNQGELVSIEYTDGTTETIALCETCRAEFADGDLVSDIELLEVEESRTSG